MASITETSLSITDTTVAYSSIPNDDVACLMYYLECVTATNDGLRALVPDDLKVWRNHMRLSTTRRALVFTYALQLSPDELIDKVIFRDDKGEIIPPNRSNMFCDISVARKTVAVLENIFIAGGVENVTSVMFFNSAWLDWYYIQPMARFLEKALISGHDEATSVTHQCICDGPDCNKKYIKTARFKCAVCKDYDLCKQCYLKGVHLAHPFSKIDRPGSPPVMVPLRESPPTRTAKPTMTMFICDGPGCGKKYLKSDCFICAICNDYGLCEKCYSQGLHPSHPFTKLDRPGSSPTIQPLRPSPPARTAQPTSAPIVPKQNSSPSVTSSTTITPSSFFYDSLNTSELKDYLREIGVGFDDIFDRETLCRRAWDVHCESMTLKELNTFLTNHDIPASGIIQDRRQKAKETFRFTRPSQPQPNKRDMVMLTGLKNYAELNGKWAEVIKPDGGNGRTLVRVDETERELSVKLENLVIW